MTKAVVKLEDRYLQPAGEVFLSSLQALVRLLIEQSRRDRAKGLKTAGYVSGYRGSPITTLDAQLWAAEKLLKEHDIHFEPGLNEELAATSLRGTQEIEWFGRPRFDGVFSMWYGKGLGVDRACEALKLANFEGTAVNGGVLVVAGDDHAAKSSASAHQSEHTLIAGFIPILYPATTDEILRYGLVGWELSRFTGLYVGLKTITDTLDLSATVTLPEDLALVRPNLPPNPPLNLLPGLSALQQEDLVVNHRLPAAVAFVRANQLDRVVIAAARPQLTIVTAGKAYLDVRQALVDLGLDERACAALGVQVVKLALIWPLDRTFIAEACRDAREVLVVEEKRPVIEEQVAAALYHLGGDSRPRIVGKQDEHGAPLLPAGGVLDPAVVRNALVGRLEALGLLDSGLEARASQLAALDDSGARLAAIARRPAFFCSGCPHNTSTVVPDGSFALGATGCHGLAAFMPERRTTSPVGMGSEGMPWVGGHHFVETPHVFQNMGDGTYTHSGILSIRAALAAKANMTFKLLFNDAVAMTGGQPMEGEVRPERIIRALVVEGAKPVVVLSDDPEQFAQTGLPSGVEVLHRDELDSVQRRLRETPGVSAIVYVQTCANELRRRRKRKIAVDPDRRLFINPAVCEGCGDCSKQSNCISIQPLETEFGRKRVIDQSNCNKDLSCIKGFCPSFVTVRGGRPAKRTFKDKAFESRIGEVPTPPLAEVGAEGYSLLITGIGGTGVLTVGAMLGQAAHIEGKFAKVLDMTGMAQKGGGVMSHVRFGADAGQVPSARLGSGQANALIACDLIVASTPDALKTAGPATQVIANADIAPTGDFQTNFDLDVSPTAFLAAVARRVDAANVTPVRATALAVRLLGDSIFTNLMMLGVAAQRGLLPVGIEAIEEAVRLNGTAVEANLRAFALGRLFVAFPDELLRVAGLEASAPRSPQTLSDMVASRRRRLVEYQDEAYARRYETFIERLAAKVNARGVGRAEDFLTVVADQLARLMAYKDEYEVARLYADPAFREQLNAEFEGDFKFAVNLAPPLLAFRRDAKTGRPRKIEFGSWIMPVFSFLCSLKGLKGGPLDVFGYTAERRMERRLIGEYEALVLEVAEAMTDENFEAAKALVSAASAIAGFGPVKDANVDAYRERLPKLLEAYRQPKVASLTVARRTRSTEAVAP